MSQFILTNKTVILELLASESQAPIPLSYGTAGFRSHSRFLPPCVLRCAILMSLRSIVDGNHVGLMITASHNPEEDNGVKLVNSEGGMLEEDWEHWAEEFVNADEALAVEGPWKILERIVRLTKLENVRRGTLVVGCDNRKSSYGLKKIAVKAAVTLGIGVIDLGYVTTPLLQHVVCRQTKGTTNELKDQYFSEKKSLFEQLIKGIKPIALPGRNLIIDCANGVGYNSMQKLQNLVSGLCVNRPSEGPLNLQCGADFVQKNRQMPTLYSCNIKTEDSALFASLDGDADRAVFFKRAEKNGEIVLADGDRCACLVADFLVSHLRILKLSPSFVVAQTAYSDGGATAFLSRLDGVSVTTTFTGVKHLEQAVRKYDIGVYWEPNGHGNVVCSKKFLDQLDNLELGRNKQMRQSLNFVKCTLRLVNQAVGDGVINILLMFAILSITGKSFEDWMQLYSSRQGVHYGVEVNDKDIIQTKDFDRTVVQPEALRAALAVLQDHTGRILVRKSGTEDIVRVFAEADTQSRAEELATCAARAVWDTCNGLGQRP